MRPWKRKGARAALLDARRSTRTGILPLIAGCSVRCGHGRWADSPRYLGHRAACRPAELAAGPMEPFARVPILTSCA